MARPPRLTPVAARLRELVQRVRVRARHRAFWLALLVVLLLVLALVMYLNQSAAVAPYVYPLF
ncbi:MAG: hypothetical protein HY906_11530 [Deltaproteobacteria bacterium]|nr:hypothetical protein [Deltaproteobacteria bacterium]